MEALGIFQDDVDVQDSTTPIDDTHANNRVRERKLLHWINSLPLTKCLLVEELRDLRFGDVLHEIVEWLQCSAVIDKSTMSKCDEFATDTMTERLRRVVQLAARECRSQDTDAMYIVNDSDCVDRIIAGHSDAICAVLTVLRRLSVQLLRSLQEAEDDKRALRHRCVQEEVFKRSLQQAQLENPHESLKETVDYKHKPKRSRPPQATTRKSRSAVDRTFVARQSPSSLSVRPRQPKPKIYGGASEKRKKSAGANSTVKPMNDKVVSRKVEIFHDSSGLHVFGMVDPTVKSPSQDVPSNLADKNGSFDENALAIRFCKWAQHVLQVRLPLEQIFIRSHDKWVLRSQQKIRQVFANGVLLGQIGTAITNRYGDQLNHLSVCGELQPFDAQNLTTLSESHRNMDLALGAFKRCGVSNEAIASIEGLQRPGINFSFKTMWRALNEVIQRLEQLPHVTVTASSQTDSKIFQTEENDAKCTPHNKSRSVDTINLKQVKSPPSRKNAPMCPKRSKSPLSKSNGSDEDSRSCAPLKRKRPYITNEQIHVVDKWLAGLGHDTKKASLSGVLHDSMRNGVLFCLMLLLVPSIEPFSFCKFPRTLTDMRENISKAFEQFEKLRFPLCYLTPVAAQAVLMGERQINYGILWHIWQVSQAQQRSIGLLDRIGDGSKITKEDRQGTNKHLPIDTAPQSSTKSCPSPLLLDVPAILLSAQGKSHLKDDQGALVLDENVTRHLAWGDNHANVSDDDVFPVPKAPSSNPVHHEEILATPHKSLDAEPGNTLKSTGQSVSNESYAQNQSTIASNFDQDVATRVESLNASEMSDDQLVRNLPRSIDNHRSEGITVDISAERTELVESINRCSKEVSVLPSSCKPSAARVAPMVTRESVDDIVKWLKRLGICIQDTAAFHDSTAKLADFQSGVLLCCIVEKVEYMRSIPGITRPLSKQQLSKASALHNITKALDILKQKKTMPLHLLRRAPAIYAGDRQVILQLLLQIRKAYGHHHTHRRPAHSSAA